MLYREFGNTGWKVSVIGFGAWGISGQWGPVDKKVALDTIHAAYDAGMNIYDTADAYGEPPGLSEELLGEGLQDVRDKVYIVTKVGHFGGRHGARLPMNHPLQVELCCDASLHRLRTDVIDLYLCHHAGTDHPEVFLEAFETLTRKGKVRTCGVSTSQKDILERFNTNGQVAGTQIEYCYLNRDAEEATFPYCQEGGIGTMVRGPLCQGVCADKFSPESTFDDWVRQKWNQGPGRDDFLKGLDIVEKLRFLKKPDRTMAQAALQFVISHPAVSTAIPGAKDPEQARANAAAGDAVLDPGELDKVRALTPEVVIRGYG